MWANENSAGGPEEKPRIGWRRRPISTADPGVAFDTTQKIRDWHAGGRGSVTLIRRISSGDADEEE